MLIQLTYASRCSHALGPADIKDILGPPQRNNARLGAALGWTADAHFGEHDLGCVSNAQYSTAAALAQQVQSVLGRPVTLVAPSPDRPIARVGWCTGGAQSYFEAAIAAGVDAYLTGEISEPQAHIAREMGVAYLAAGHHATERYGAPAVAAQVAASASKPKNHKTPISLTLIWV